MASKKTPTQMKAERKDSIRSQFTAEEQELFDLLVAHYVRAEAQRKNILGDFHRMGMAPARATAVALAAIQYLADSPKRPNDGRYPRQRVLFKNVSGETIGRIQQRVDTDGAPISVTIGSQYLPPGTWEVVAIEVPEEECPKTRRGGR